MTRIDFYFNVANKQQAILGLVESALKKRRQVTVLAADTKIAADVSVNLWQTKPDSFLPNVQSNHTHASRSPVLIALQGDAIINHSAQNDILINLTSTEPNCFSSFTQLVELVGDDEQDKTAARLRFKFYRDRGYDIKSTNYAENKAE